MEDYMTTQFIVTSDLSSVPFTDYEKNALQIKKDIEKTQSKQNEIMGKISSRMLPDPQGYKQDIEECKTSLKQCRIQIKRLQENLPHLKEIGKIADGFKLLQAIRVDYLESKHKNKQLLLLKDSDHFKRAYCLSKETMKSVETAQTATDKDSKIKDIFEKVGPLITSQHEEIQSLQDAYLTSQIHSFHIELLSFMAAKSTNNAITALITKIQATTQTNINPINGKYQAQFPDEKTPLLPHLSFQNSRGVFHWMKQNWFYNDIKTEISELETIAKDLQILQSKFKTKIIDSLAPSSSNQVQASSEVLIGHYQSLIDTISAHIRHIAVHLSSKTNVSSGHYGVYYGSRLLEFLEEVRWYFDKYASLERCANRVMCLPKEVFAQVAKLADPIIHQPSNTYKKLQRVYLMVTSFAHATDTTKKTFLDKQLHNIFLVCHQTVAKVGSEALKTIDSGDIYDMILQRKPFDIATNAPFVGKEVLMRRHFSTKPEWQLHLLLHSCHLYQEVASLTGNISTILAHNFDKDTAEKAKIFSTLFFDLTRYKWSSFYHMHYLNLYAKYHILLEGAQSCDQELVKAASSKLDELQKTYDFPQFLPKKILSKQEPDEETQSSEEVRSFNMYARGLWGTKEDFQETLGKMTLVHGKESPLKSFFIMHAFYNKKLEQAENHLPQLLSEYLRDDEIALGFRHIYGYIYCETLLFDWIRTNKIDDGLVKKRRGEQGYGVWLQAMQFLLEKSPPEDKKQSIERLRPGETQYAPIICAVLEELKTVMAKKKQTY
jgi:hypothetical protein